MTIIVTILTISNIILPIHYITECNHHQAQPQTQEEHFQNLNNWGWNILLRIRENNKLGVNKSD